MTKPRVVVFSPVVPYDRIPHAGGQYLEQLLRLLAPDADVTLLAPGTRTNLDALEESRSGAVASPDARWPSERWAARLCAATGCCAGSIPAWSTCRCCSA